MGFDKIKAFPWGVLETPFVVLEEEVTEGKSAGDLWTLRPYIS